jgi:Fe-S-cluster-containing dehydrogenase component
VACKDEFVGNPYPPYSYPQPDRGQDWIDLLEIEKGKHPYVKAYPIPLLCMHCKKAPCIDACPIPDCIYRTESGVIIIDPAKCDLIKCDWKKPCIASCPYRVIFFNDDKNICQKCTLCIHRLEEGKEPACVDACPSSVYIFGEEAEIIEEAKKRGAKWMHPEYGIEPVISYIGLPSVSLAGHVIGANSLMDVTGADITVTDNKAGSSVSCKSNVAGNFLVEDLKIDNVYSVEIACRGYLTKTIDDVRIDTEYKHLGDVKLSETS